MSTADHDRLRDILAAVALGAATPEEIAAVERHADSCPVCREELDGLRAATAALAAAVPQVDPPRRLRSRVLAAVRAEPARAGARRRRRLPRLTPRVAWPVAAAVASAAALAFLGWSLALHGEQPSVRTVALTGQGPVRGELLETGDRDAAVVRLRNLPPLARGRAWELWVIRGTRPSSAGFMTATAPGRASVATADLHGVTALAVTPEPRTNTRAPTGRMVVVVPLGSRG
jgi:anti-sigma-K factor RskA